MVRVSDSLGRPIIRALDDAPANLRPLRGVVDGMSTKKRRDRDGVNDVDNYNGSGGNPPIDRSRNPDWLNDKLDRDDLEPWERNCARGQQFNYQNHHRYPANEITLANGKRLDSYAPDVSIVSRKNTQLDSVKPQTANSYVDEILNKYPPGTEIVGGGTLSGDLVLEVPVQAAPVPQSVIDHANGKIPPVIIRDVLGNEYN